MARIRQMSKQVSRGSAGDNKTEEKGEGGDRGDLVEKKESPKWERAVKPVISLPSKNGYSAGEYKADEQELSRGSAGEYQADEQAGVARLSWRVSGR